MPTANRNNYAFIDSQNVHLGVLALGWRLDWRRFRTYLREKHTVTRAFLFLGYISDNRKLYEKLMADGYEIILKKTVINRDGTIKANVDVELTLHAVVRKEHYDGAVIVSGDGDFACLVEYLADIEKFTLVISPNRARTSSLLRKAAGTRIDFIDDLRFRL